MSSSMEESFQPFSFQGYDFMKPIGKGTYSTAYEVISQKYHTKFCAKATKLPCSVLKIEDISADPELLSLCHLSHPHVIRVYNFFAIENWLIMILQYCDGGSLGELIANKGPIPSKKLANYALKIASAVQFCHSKGIVHRDIKPNNIFLSNQEPILGDFGLASIMIGNKFNDSEYVPCGSPFYAAPEMFSGKPYDLYKADVWSLGATFFEMATGKPPFSEEIIEHHLQNPGELEFPLYFPPLFKALIFRMLRLDPKDRPTMNEVLESPFFLAAAQAPSYPHLKLTGNKKNSNTESAKALLVKPVNPFVRNRASSMRVPSKKLISNPLTFSD